MEYEIYTYGEQAVIVPVKGSGESPMEKLAKKQILSEVRRFDKNAVVELLSSNKVVVRVENDMIPRIIGKGGETIKELEQKLGVSIDVSPKIATLGKEIDFDEEEKGAYIIFTIHAKPGKIVNF